jgi:hypothetical protein
MATSGANTGGGGALRALGIVHQREEDEADDPGHGRDGQRAQRRRPCLVEAGEPVRGLVRAGSEAALPDDVEPAVGDLNDADSFAPALHGVSGVFMLSGYRGLERTLATEHADAFR